MMNLHHWAISPCNSNANSLLGAANSSVITETHQRRRGKEIQGSEPVQRRKEEKAQNWIREEEESYWLTLELNQELTEPKKAQGIPKIQIKSPGKLQVNFQSQHLHIIIAITRRSWYESLNFKRFRFVNSRNPKNGESYEQTLKIQGEFESSRIWEDSWTFEQARQEEMTNRNRIRTSTRIHIKLVISRSFCLIFVIRTTK